MILKWQIWKSLKWAIDVLRASIVLCSLLLQFAQFVVDEKYWSLKVTELGWFHQKTSVRTIYLRNGSQSFVDAIYNFAKSFTIFCNTFQLLNKVSIKGFKLSNDNLLELQWPFFTGAHCSHLNLSLWVCFQSICKVLNPFSEAFHFIRIEWFSRWDRSHWTVWVLICLGSKLWTWLLYQRTS